MENPQCFDALDMMINKGSKRNKYVIGILWNRVRLFFMLSEAESTNTKENHLNGNDLLMYFKNMVI